MPRRLRKPSTDPDGESLASVEQETADEADIQKQVDLASEVRRPRKPPSDPIQAAHSPEKNAAAVALGKLGGAKGGKKRAAGMTPEERKEAARKAAAARWESKKTRP